jgi:hypothetical protein
LIYIEMLLKRLSNAYLMYCIIELNNIWKLLKWDHQPALFIWAT